ncbi:MAG: hypothetical protein M3O02_11615 [Acidobacteriota bacterium]|nr:hypothetical protein [Acidobacteriota bacterium]
MKLSRILALAALASTSALISCAGPAGYSYKNVQIALTFNPICNGVACIGGGLFNEVGQPTNAGDLIGPTGAIRLSNTGSGGCVEIYATITNAPPNFTWTLYPTPPATVPSQPSGSTYAPTLPATAFGTLSSTTGGQNYYCEATSMANLAYSGATLAQAQALGIQAGETEVIVSAPADPNNPSVTVSATQTFTVEVAKPPSDTNGTMLVGIVQSTPPSSATSTAAASLSIPLRSQYQFNGYVIGLNGYYTPAGTTTPLPAQSQIWYVTAPGGIPIAGGNSTIGTISSTGLYTAPAAYPPSGKTVTITMASAVFPSVVTGGVGEGAPVVITFQ